MFVENLCISCSVSVYLPLLLSLFLFYLIFSIFFSALPQFLYISYFFQFLSLSLQQIIFSIISKFSGVFKSQVYSESGIEGWEELLWPFFSFFPTFLFSEVGCGVVPLFPPPGLYVHYLHIYDVCLCLCSYRYLYI